MAAKRKMTVSTQPTSYRPTSAERHAAQVAWLSTQQAELKREAADRRAERAIKSAPDAATTRGVLDT
jgi:hypothetical protein